MKNFKKVNVLEYLKENYKSDDFKKAYKFQKIKARVGILGEEIVTVMKNGLRETVNTVKKDSKTGELDRVVTNLDGEEYIIPYETFVKKYEQTPDAEGYYKPKGGIVNVVKVKDNISFTAPWGSIMNIEKGGYLVINNKDDIYGIQKEEFFNTYKIIEATEEVCPTL